jgi:hypothetical protein
MGDSGLGDVFEILSVEGSAVEGKSGDAQA